MRTSGYGSVVAALSVLGLGCAALPPEFTGNQSTSGTTSVADSSGTGGAPSTVADSGSGDTVDATSSTGAVVEPTTGGGSSGPAGSSGSLSSSGSSGSPGSSGLASGETTVGLGEGSSGSGEGSSDSGPDPLGMFDEPVLVAELSSEFDDDDPTLTADMLEIYFATQRSGGGPASEDIWRSTRLSVDDPWDAPEPVIELNGGGLDTHPDLSADGLVIMFASERPGTEQLDIFYSERASRLDAWSVPTRLESVSTEFDDFAANPTPTMDALVLCWTVPEGPGQTDLWQVDADFDTWTTGPAVLLAELSTPQAECGVSLSSDQREIYLESTRGGGWDLWRASRPEPADAWGVPVALDEVNSAGADSDPWISADGRTLYLASNRGGMGYDLYVAERR